MSVEGGQVQSRAAITVPRICISHTRSPVSQGMPTQALG